MGREWSLQPQNLQEPFCQNSLQDYMLKGYQPQRGYPVINQKSEVQKGDKNKCDIYWDPQNILMALKDSMCIIRITTPAGSSWFPWILNTGKPTLKWGSS